MVSELERGEGLKTSPFFGREIGQYHVQTVNFRASKKDPSIAAIEPRIMTILLLCGREGFSISGRYLTEFPNGDIAFPIWKHTFYSRKTIFQD